MNNLLNYYFFFNWKWMRLCKILLRNTLKKWVCVICIGSDSYCVSICWVRHTRQKQVSKAKRILWENSLDWRVCPRHSLGFNILGIVTSCTIDNWFDKFETVHAFLSYRLVFTRKGGVITKHLSNYSGKVLASLVPFPPRSLFFSWLLVPSGCHCPVST